MSKTTTSFVLGYHGCSRDTGLRAIESGLALEQSKKDYDWLGPGVYFWEGDPQRAMEWAEEKVRRKVYRDAFVIGAVIDLGNCLDLLLRENLELLASAHASLARMSRKAGLAMPKNQDRKAVNKGDKLLRYRDCAVIKHLHSMIEDPVDNPAGHAHFETFDTVRGLFVEGRRVYPGGGFFSRTHTQLAVRSDRCIKGIFIPR